MTTSAVSTLIYQNAGTMQAAAAGFILLSMISVSVIDPLHPILTDRC